MDNIAQNTSNQPALTQSIENPIPTPTPPQKKSNIFIILISSFILSIGMIYLYGKFLLPALPLDRIIFPTPTINQTIITPTGNDNSTVSWKTYTNVTQGYELKYPADWNMKEKDCGLEANLDRTTCFESPDYIIDLAGFGTSKGGIISINGKHRNIGQEPSQLTACLLSPTHPCSIERTKLNGYNILKILDNSSRGAIIGFIENNKISLIIEVNYNPESKIKVLETFNQILPTFKFLDNQIDINTPGTESSFSGIVKKTGYRPAPDIRYDYEIIFDKPLVDITSGAGKNQTINKIIIEGIGLNFETYLNKHISCIGSLEWGYAEHRVLEVTKIIDSN